MTPLYYIEREGDFWQSWSGKRDVWLGELDSKRKSRAKDQPCIFIEGQRVHALLFTDGRAWDVINGFREGNHWLERLQKALAEPIKNDDWCETCSSPALSCRCVK